MQVQKLKIIFDFLTKKKKKQYWKNNINSNLFDFFL